MRHATAVPSPAFQPFAQINITPLIDVMLVLLIMFILTIPAATHKVPLDLPRAGGHAAPPAETHRLRIAEDGALSFDGATIDEPALRTRLAAVAAGGSTLQLETASEARYARFDQILADIKRSGITRLGFVGNERFTW